MQGKLPNLHESDLTPNSLGYLGTKLQKATCNHGSHSLGLGVWPKTWKIGKFSKDAGKMEDMNKGRKVKKKKPTEAWGSKGTKLTQMSSKK